MRIKQIHQTPDLETLAEAYRPPSQGLSLRKNFSWTLVGNVVYAGCQWGMLVVLAKLGSPTMVGKFALGLAITAPVILFFNLSLRSIQATDAKQDYLFGHYLGLRLITTMLALLVIIGIVSFGHFQLETKLVILSLGLAKALESISDAIYGLLQQHERMDRIATSMLIKGPLSLLALGTGVYFTKVVLWGVLGTVVVWGLVLMFYDMRSGILILSLSQQKPEGSLPNELKRDSMIYPIWDFAVLRRLAYFTLPMGIVAMLLSVNSNIPRYFIERYLGEAELGIFAAMASLMIAGGTVVNALGQSAMPRLAKCYAVQNARGFRNLLLKMVAIGAFLGLAGVLLIIAAGREIITIIYRPEYAEQIGVLFWLMLTAGINYLGSFLGYGMTAQRYFRIQMPLFALVGGTTALLCFLFIPDHGLQGAAQSLLVSGVIQLGLTWVIIWHGLRNLATEVVDA